MDRIQEVLALDDFFLFLSSRKIYTNKLTYFEYLSLWITKASTGLSHHKHNYQWRALKLFDQYYQEFSSLLPSQLPSFRFSIPPLFSKKDVYVGWPYMETKWQQQKTLTTKKSNLDLNAFLCSVTYLPIKDINKHFIFDLGDTNDVMFNLNGFLDFNPINNYHKSRVLSCMNGTILDITFKFKTGPNMRLIFDSFYAPRKKRRLVFNRLDVICDHNLLRTFNIEFYIDFVLLFFCFIFSYFFFFSFFQNFVYISWKFVTLSCYIFLIWEIWRFFLMFMCIVWGTLSRRLNMKYY
jgi:hypothetical protein